MIAVLDLDDTILDLETPLTEVFPVITHWKDSERYKNRSKILNSIFDNDLLINLKAFSKALDFINDLRNNNIQIVLITARAWHPNAEEITRTNLEKNNIIFDDLIICELNKNKGEFLNKNDRYILSIEDNPYNHMNLKFSGVERPYCRITEAFSYNNIPAEELIRCHSEIKI